MMVLFLMDMVIMISHYVAKILQQFSFCASWKNILVWEIMRLNTETMFFLVEPPLKSPVYYKSCDIQSLSSLFAPLHIPLFYNCICSAERDP